MGGLRNGCNGRHAMRRCVHVRAVLAGWDTGLGAAVHAYLLMLRTMQPGMGC